jgi:hypothetical protein
MTLTIDELKERISNQFDPDLVVEMLEITTEELLENFHDRLVDNINKFELEGED